MDINGQKYIWNDIDLDELRQVMDKPADDAIDALFESKSIDRLVSILQEMAENESPVSNELPKAMRDFIEHELDIEFSAEDIAHFKATREIWEDKGTKFILILLFRALPFTYMAEKPANVLRMTKLLKTQPKRRIFETAQFVFDVMEKKWWEPDQRGILTALKVRIMHAAMRQLVLDNDYGEIWNLEWGNPISQEDLIATNQVFSLEFFKGLELLGDPLTPEEQESWFHTWKVIGRIMGIQENLLCKNVEEAWSLQHAIYEHLFNDEPYSGIMLAEALAEALDDLLLPRKLVIVLMKKMLEDESYPDCLERLLGPGFKNEFPELFTTPQTDEEKTENKQFLRQEYYTNLKEFNQIVKDKTIDLLQMKPDRNLLNQSKTRKKRVLNRFQQRKPLHEIHNNKLQKTLKFGEDENKAEEFKEEILNESMSALSGVVIGVLALHFRSGKQSGFRIPKTLRANWSRTGKRKKSWFSRIINRF